MSRPERAIEVVGAVGPAPRDLEKSIEAVAAHLRMPEGAPVALARASFRIVGDEEMAALHVRHSGVEGTTDVLTFVDAAAPSPVETDIAICRDVAARESTARGTSVESELLLYAVHGLLHAAGFDDATDDDARRMHEEEDRILGAIGVGAVYAVRRRDL